MTKTIKTAEYSAYGYIEACVRYYNEYGDDIYLHNAWGAVEIYAMIAEEPVDVRVGRDGKAFIYNLKQAKVIY